MPPDHTGVSLGVPKRVPPGLTVEEITPPSAAKYAVISAEGAAGKCAGTGTQTDGAVWSGDYKAIAVGADYTLQVDDGTEVVNGARTFFVGSDGASDVIVIQYVD